MAVSGDVSNFRTVYDDLTQEVMRSHGSFLADHLQKWYRNLDTTPEVSSVVQGLQSGLDFDAWSKEQAAKASGMGGTLTWPDDSDKRLGMQLLLFRGAASGKADIAWYGHIYIPSSDLSISNAARRCVDQIFGPMARELRRRVEREFSNVPAADRVVKRTDNQAAYLDLLEKVAKLEEALRTSNEYQDVEEKEQRIAEVSAGHRLLQAAQVRVEAFATLLRPVVVQFTTRVKDNLITAAALAVSGAIIALLGHIL